MTATHPNAAATLEVVGTFSDREHFQAAIDRLIAAGFDRTDLSVLSSHESIDVAVGHEPKSWKDSLITLVGELKYEGPLVAAGLIALAAGPVGATIAGLVAAGVGGAAVKELLDEVAALPDSQQFADALAEGHVIVWVAVTDEAQQQRAVQILRDTAAQNVHVFERKGR
ncbi:MAG: hypothetical protein H7Z12_17120 [Rhodospirillaceae bacterium]|nr:hypothetical protein [Rhodospirillales bacterium]